MSGRYRNRIKWECPEERKERLRADWKKFADREKAEIAKQREVGFRNRAKPTLVGNNASIGKKKILPLLKMFWSGWDKMESSELKLAALINIANQFSGTVSRKVLIRMRKSYNLNKRRTFRLVGEKCSTCDRKAKVRHHIIPLVNGGINHKLNLILVCEECHQEIHPWMKAS